MTWMTKNLDNGTLSIVVYIVYIALQFANLPLIIRYSVLCALVLFCIGVCHDAAAL